MYCRLIRSYVALILFLGLHQTGLAQKAVEEDRKVGEKVARQVESSIGIYKAPRTEELIFSVGNRLVRNLDSEFSEFSFQILDQLEPNAFAAPGGFIYVSRGLLVLVNSEDELAGVLGHEITHVSERHAHERQKKSVFSSIIKIPGNIVGSVVGEGLGNILNAPWDALSANYSRKQESEADRLGMKLTADSGYDPTQLAAILNRMQEEIEALTDEKIRFNFFDSHPSTPKRVQNIHKEASQLSISPAPPALGDRNEFLQRLNGLHFNANPANGVFQQNRFLHADLDLAITFPAGWKHINMPVAVGCMTPNGDAFILLGLEDSKKDPLESGKEMERQLRERGIAPLESGPIKTDHWQGYLLAFGQYTNHGPTVLSMIMLTMGGRNYKIMASGTNPLQNLIEKSTYSLRPITQEERNSISSLRIRLAEARDNETISDFCERTGNSWDPGFTALVNGLGADQLLEEGQLIKIARKEPYLP